VNLSLKYKANKNPDRESIGHPCFVLSLDSHLKRVFILPDLHYLILSRLNKQERIDELRRQIHKDLLNERESTVLRVTSLDLMLIGIVV
jgi:hypothetical protein